MGMFYYQVCALLRPEKKEAVGISPPQTHHFIFSFVTNCENMEGEYTDEIEFGRIVVLMKDGTEGSALGVTGDVHFGRDKSSDIRIKLPSVSRDHALLSVDQNGQVRIHI